MIEFYFKNMLRNLRLWIHWNNKAQTSTEAVIQSFPSFGQGAGAVLGNALQDTSKYYFLNVFCNKEQSGTGDSTQRIVINPFMCRRVVVRSW